MCIATQCSFTRCRSTPLPRTPEAIKRRVLSTKKFVADEKERESPLFLIPDAYRVGLQDTLYAIPDAETRGRRARGSYDSRVEEAGKGTCWRVARIYPRGRTRRPKTSRILICPPSRLSPRESGSPFGHPLIRICGSDGRTQISPVRLRIRTCNMDIVFL